MPILRLQADRQAQFPCIGKLRKGAPKSKNANGKEVMGKDLTHFRFDSDDTEAMQAFTAYYGSEPNQISVYMPYQTVEQNFTAWLEEYRAGGLVRRCDGEQQAFHRDAKGNADLKPIACERLCNRKCGCKEVGRLAVIVPELARLAYVLVETHSVYDIIQLTENLQAAQALRGDLRGIPFILSRREREISMPSGEDGKRVRRAKWLLFIEPDPAWVRLQLESTRLAALPLVDMPSTVNVPPQYSRALLIDSQAGPTEEEDDEEEGVYTEVTQPPEPEKPPTIGAAELAELLAVAQEFYGAEWLEKEPKVADGASHGAVQTIAELTPKEAADLLGILKTRLAKRQAQAAPPPVQAAVTDGNPFYDAPVGK